MAEIRRRIPTAPESIIKRSKNRKVIDSASLKSNIYFKSENIYLIYNEMNKTIRLTVPYGFAIQIP